jgi:hypothetical protein
MGHLLNAFFSRFPTRKIRRPAAGKFPQEVLTSRLNGQEPLARLQIFARRA